MKLFQMKRIFGGIKMSWTTILKNEQEWELREQKQRREDKAASYDKPPKRHKRDIRDDDKCYVRRCEAVSCKYNKDYNCILENIDIDSKGVCRDFTPKKDIRDKPEDIRDKPRGAANREIARRIKDIRDKID